MNYQLRIANFLLFIIIISSCSFSGNRNTQVEYMTVEEAVAAVKAMKDSLSGFDLNYIMGQFEPTTHPDFTVVDDRYTDKDGSYYLRKDTYEAFKKMHVAAQKDDVKLVIRSATRNFAHQKRIWEGKWTGKRLLEGNINATSIKNPKDRALKILEYSSMPGTSRHHWGTDIDMNAFVNSYFEKGNGLKEYEWLVANAVRFGFCQPYTPKGEIRPHGYNEEKWHWSYLPVAKQLTDLYQIRGKDTLISGFQGAETAISIGVIEKYVLGINEECL